TARAGARAIVSVLQFNRQAVAHLEQGALRNIAVYNLADTKGNVVVVLVRQINVGVINSKARFIIGSVIADYDAKGFIAIRKLGVDIVITKNIRCIADRQCNRQSKTRETNAGSYFRQLTEVRLIGWVDVGQHIQVIAEFTGLTTKTEIHIVFITSSGITRSTPHTGVSTGVMCIIQRTGYSRSTGAHQ